jgi:glycosyltransferase involved in cell wall biosynthesis
MSTKPRIAIFLPSLNGGGAERAMVLFACTIQELGVDVEIVCAEKKGVLLPLIESRMSIVDLAAPRMLRAVFRLRAYLKKSKPDVLYATIVHANLAAVMASGGLRKQIKVILRESNAPISEKKRTVTRRISHRLVPRFYPRADAVIAVSTKVRDELLQVAPKLKTKLKVLETPVIPGDFVTQAAEDPMHAWFKEGEPPVILGVGRLHSQKNFPLLINAFAEVRKKLDCRLMILGQGLLKKELQALVDSLGITDHVCFAGFCLNPFSYMSRARVFVLSSNYEGMPNVLIQAMALATPVVATDCPGGNAECLENGALGELVPVGDVAKMAQAIEKSLEIRQRSDVAIKITQRFGAEAASRAYLELAGVVIPNRADDLKTGNQ